MGERGEWSGRYRVGSPALQRRFAAKESYLVDIVLEQSYSES